MTYLYVGLAGGLGAMLRFFIGRSFVFAGSASWPISTFFVNVAGSLLIGFVLTAFSLKAATGDDLKTALTVGFLGGFTTFSAFSYETMQLLDRGEVAKSVAYVCSTVALCLFACWLGMLLAKLFFKQVL